MDGSRRGFLKLAGLTALGAAGASSIKALAQHGEGAKVTVGVHGEKRWAMVVDLKKFRLHNSWDRCIEACHSVHNVPSIPEKDDEIKWIWTEEFEHAFPSQEHEYVAEQHRHQPVPVLCNHCNNPPCTRVCPTQATWRRESDGLVMMDWHRCIGCRYCIVACPYGSRSFNWRDPRPHIKGEVKIEYPTRMRGVVEKCTFCEERLAKGLQPACVEACQHGEMAFGNLEDPNSEVRHLLRENFTIRRKAGLGTEPEVYYIV
jgi:molybdopterin-containing oxidoreductase family iron-sulfur binding subunit